MKGLITIFVLASGGLAGGKKAAPLPATLTAPPTDQEPSCPRSPAV